MHAFLKQQENFQINKLTYHLKEIEDEQQQPKSVEGNKEQRSIEKIN